MYALKFPFAVRAPDMGGGSSPAPALTLSGSVGSGGANRREDVLMVKQRMRELGFGGFDSSERADLGLIRSINLVQSIVRGAQKVSGDGRIDVGGYGGKSNSSVASAGGGGGGSGGALLLEAPAVRIQGAELCANGGGGGEGGVGESGSSSMCMDVPAQGGGTTSINSGGGQGASGSFPAGLGMMGGMTGGGGGGGGGIGIIRINGTISGTPTVITPPLPP